MENRIGSGCSIFHLVTFYFTLKMETADSSVILIGTLVLHGITSIKTTILMDTVMRSSNLALYI
jgi:hypothetical protein